MAFTNPNYKRGTVPSRYFAPEEPGAVLEGTFLGIETKENTFGDMETHAGVREADGNERTVKLSSKLGKQFDALRPKIGNGVKVTYQGRDDAVKGPHKPRLFVLELAPQFDDAKMLAVIRGSDDELPF